MLLELSLGEREHYMYFQYLLPNICVLYRGVSSLECPLREGPLYYELNWTVIIYLDFRDYISCQKKIMLNIMGCVKNVKTENAALNIVK